MHFNNQQGTNLQIQGLRGIACILVMLFHLTSRYAMIFNGASFNCLAIDWWGGIGVIIFLLISGCYILPKESNRYSIVLYYFKRISKIYPVYLVCMTLIFLLTHLFYLPNRTVGFKEYLTNFLMINSFFYIDYVDGAHWYLTTLIVAVFIIGIISLNKNMNLLFLIWIVLSVVVNYIYNTNEHLVMRILFKITGDSYVGIIVMGIIIPRIYKSLSNKKEMFWNIVLFLFAIAYTYYLHAWIYTVVVCILVIIVTLAYYHKISILSNRLLVWFGTISFSLYLIHQNFGYLIIYYLTQIFKEYHYIYILIAFLADTLIGYLIYIFLEAPINRWINYKYGLLSNI